MLSNLLPRNEHPYERALRVVPGAGLLALVFVGPHSMWGLLGLAPLLTGLVGSCPAYTLLHVSTNKHATP